MISTSKINKGDRLVAFDAAWTYTQMKKGVESGVTTLRGAICTVKDQPVDNPGAQVLFDDGPGWVALHSGGTYLDKAQLYYFQGTADYLAYAMIQNGYPADNYEDVRAAATMLVNTLKAAGVEIPLKDGDADSIAKFTGATYGVISPSQSLGKPATCAKCGEIVMENWAGFWENSHSGPDCKYGGPHKPTPTGHLIKEADPELEKLLAEEDEIDKAAKAMLQQNLEAQIDKLVATTHNGWVETFDAEQTCVAVTAAGYKNPNSLTHAAGGRWFKAQVSACDDEEKAIYFVQAFRTGDKFKLIDSIKQLRATTMLGLKEAKDMIDAAKIKVESGDVNKDMF